MINNIITRFNGTSNTNKYKHLKKIIFIILYIKKKNTTDSKKKKDLVNK